MSKTATIRARIEPDLKTEAEDVLEGLGLSATQAITLLYRQLALQRRLPFDLALPNAVTANTFRKTDAGEDVVHCDDLDDLFEKLEL